MKGSWTEVRKEKIEVAKVKRRRIERASNMGKGGLIRSSRPTPPLPSNSPIIKSDL